MKIAALTISFPNLSEQFVVREFAGLAARGHDVRVFTARPPAGPLQPTTELPVAFWDDKAIHDFAPDILYASLGMRAHVRCVELGRAFRTPYVLRLWEGYDAFACPSPEFYGPLSDDPYCRAVIIEDEWMRGFVAGDMLLAGEKVHIVPNGVDVDVFTPPWLHGPTETDRPVRVLSIARFVVKKGLRHLCAAYRARRPANSELVIIGYGPDEEYIRAAAGLNTGITFRPPIPPDQLADEYRAADIFAAPCISPKGGDADGVPTTVLEAMACGLPILGSALHSMPLYVEDGVSGILTEPGNEEAIGDALECLIADGDMRRTMGARARREVVTRFSLIKSLDAIEYILCP